MSSMRRNAARRRTLPCDCTPQTRNLGLKCIGCFSRANHVPREAALRMLKQAGK